MGEFIDLSTSYMLLEIGKLGFILLLFLIGLEIEVPPFQMIKKSITFCASWLILQNLLCLILGWFLGYGLGFIFVAAIGINACSLGISYGLLKSQENSIDEPSRKQILTELALIEILSLFVLVGSDAVLEYGVTMEVVWHIAIILLFVLIIRVSASFVHKRLAKLIETQGKWKIHQLLLIILFIVIIGERLGLSAPKTAFFLGLFMSAATNRGIKLEDELNPIAQRALIPLFLVGIGTKINIFDLDRSLLLVPILITGILFTVRYFIFRYTNTTSLSNKYFLILCPNITMVAVAAEVLLYNDFDKDLVDLLLITGLLMTVIAALFFPTKKPKPVEASG